MFQFGFDARVEALTFRNLKAAKKHRLVRLHHLKITARRGILRTLLHLIFGHCHALPMTERQDTS
jgi:hypothetical protein